MAQSAFNRAAKRQPLREGEKREQRTSDFPLLRSGTEGEGVLVARSACNREAQRPIMGRVSILFNFQK
ncbi:MAG: hypothetical protein EBX40_01930 [Gammaproteobacteria bacterium]|nr:hypothetical protein [Gammaproteobacteria bacterium]